MGNTIIIRPVKRLRSQSKMSSNFRTFFGGKSRFLRAKGLRTVVLSDIMSAVKKGAQVYAGFIDRE